MESLKIKQAAMRYFFVFVFPIGVQASFDEDWSLGRVNASTWTPEASDNTVIAYKLLLQTGKFEQPTDEWRIGCKSHNTPCERVSFESENS